MSCDICGLDVQLEDGTCGACGGGGPVISLPELIPLKREVAAEIVALLREEVDVAAIDLSGVVAKGESQEYYRGLATGLITGAQVTERHLKPTLNESQGVRGAWLMCEADYGVLQFAAVLMYLEPDALELKPKADTDE